MTALATLDTPWAKLMAEANADGRTATELRIRAIPATLYDPTFAAMIIARADELQARQARLWDEAQALATTSSHESHVGLAAKWAMA